MMKMTRKLGRKDGGFLREGGEKKKMIFGMVMRKKKRWDG